MPFANEHAGRVRTPDQFVRIVQLQKLPNGIRILGGPLKSNPTGPTQAQSYRFPKSRFTEDQAKEWLSDHEIKVILFEPAQKDNMTNFAPRYIQNVSQDSADIFLYDQIGGGGINGQTFADEISALNKFGVKLINVHISSPGGSILDGLSIFSAIRNSKATVHTHIDGIVASMAGIIAMAGEKVFMADFGSLMIHDPSFPGNDTPDDNQKNALSTLRNSLLTILENRTNKKHKELSSIMSAETWLTPQAALDGGFIDEIVTTKVNNTTPRMEVSDIVNVLGVTEDNASDEFPINGPRLASLFNRKINSMMTDDKSRSDIISDIAGSAGISDSTVGQILRGDITCPPTDRLEGFSSALNISMSSINTAATADGCNISNNLNPNFKTMTTVTDMLNLNADASEGSILEAVKKIASQLTDANNALTTSEDKLKTAEATIVTQKETITSFEDRQTDLNKTIVEDTVQAAIDAGKFDKKDKETLVEKFEGNVEGLKLVVDSIKTPAAMINGQLTGDTGETEIPEDRKDWPLRKWEKEDAVGLEKIRTTNSELYATMYKAQYGVNLPTAK